MSKRIKKGNTYMIRFYDHANGSNSIEFTILGRCVKISKNDIVIAVWFYGNDNDFNVDDPNVETYAIVKGAIIESLEIQI